MPYSTITDILKDLPAKELVNLTNDENRLFPEVDLTNEDDPVVIRVNKAIEDADNEINSYLLSRYSIPLQPVPQIIKKISCDIAIYNLYCRRFRVDTPYRDVYLSRISELKLIQAEKMHLPIDNISDEKSLYLSNNNQKEFTKQKLKDYWNI